MVQSLSAGNESNILQAKHHLMKYFLCYTVDSSNASVDVRDGPKDTAFVRCCAKIYRKSSERPSPSDHWVIAQ